MSECPWVVPEPWLERCRALVRAEIERLERTARYRLGRDLLASVRRPWLLARLLNTVHSIARSGGAGNTPPLSPPYPICRKSTQTFGDPASRDRLRRDIARLWQRARELETSLEFRVGNAFAEARASRSGVYKLPQKLRQLVSADPPTERTVDPESLVPLVTVEPPPEPAPTWRCLAPSWLEEILALDGVPRYRPTEPPVGGLLVGLDASNTATGGPNGLEDALTAAERKSAPVALWLLDEGDAPPPKSLVSRCRAVFVADSRRVPQLSESLSVPVHPLPPAIQPRLHNPIGWWSGAPELGVSGYEEHKLPRAWRSLVALARGRSLSAGDLAAVKAALDRELPRGNPPSWARPELAADWIRHARCRGAHRAETLAHRLRAIDAALDLDPAESAEPLVTVLACTNRPNLIPRVLDSFERQSYEPRELVLVAHGHAFDLDAVRHRLEALSAPARLVHVSDKLSLGEALQAGTERGDGQLFVRMDDDDWYGAHYVEDYVHAFRFSDAALIGKPSFVLHAAERRRLYLCNPGIEYQYTIFRGGGPKLAFRRAVLSHVAWRPLWAGEDKWFVRDCLANGFPPLAGDRFNFVYHRGRPQTHTTSRPVDEWIAVNKAIPYPASAKPSDFES